MHSDWQVDDAIAAAQSAEARHQWSEASVAWARAEITAPHDHQLPMHRAQALWLGDDSAAALTACARALHLGPSEALVHRLHGHILRDLNRFEEAEKAYEIAMGLEGGGSALTAWGRSQVLIGLERYKDAFALAERRFGAEGLRPWRHEPWWQGWPADGAKPEPRELVIWSEQGLGDSLQFVRWIPELVSRGYRVRLEVEPVLVPLLRQGLARLGPALTITPQGLCPRPLRDPCQGSLLSLPWLLGGAPLTNAFSADHEINPVGYLRSPSWGHLGRQNPARRQAPGTIRVGLVWASGRKLHDGFIAREYQRRSLPATDLISLLEGLQQIWCESGGDAGRLDLINLQIGADRLRAEGWSGRFYEEMADDASLAANAELMASLDLLITVDTASAHLAGALALPAWVLLPWSADPRWLRHREDSPWYPSLTLLRQPAPRDWPALVTLVLDRFRRWIGPPPGG